MSRLLKHSALLGILLHLVQRFLQDISGSLEILLVFLNMFRISLNFCSCTLQISFDLIDLEFFRAQLGASLTERSL